MRSIFVERRDQLALYWKEEGFGYLDQELLKCEMVDPYTYRSKLGAFEGDFKVKYKEKTANKEINTT